MTVSRRRDVGSPLPMARAVPAEVLKKVRRIEILAKRLLDNQFLGEYRSIFKGRGIDFADNREYVTGDDVRAINWSVTARLGTPFVKQFEEERQLTVFLLVDVSPSGRFGSSGRSKLDVAAEMASLIAFSAVRNHDRVGLVAFTDRVESFVPPRTGRRQLLRLIRELVSIQPEGRGTDISSALSFLGKIQRKVAVVFLLSDFYSRDFTKALRAAGRRHDLVALAITDPAELDLPRGGLVRMEDAETGRQRLIDTEDRRVRETYHRLVSETRASRDAELRQANVATVEVRTDESYLKPLLRLFRRRERRN